MPWQPFEPNKRKVAHYYYECLDPSSPAIYIIINENINTLEVKFNNNPQGQDSIHKIGSKLELLDESNRRYVLHNYNMYLYSVVEHIVGLCNAPQQLLELISDTIPPDSPWRRPARDPSKPVLTVTFDEESIQQTTGLTARIRRAKAIAKSSSLSKVQTNAGDSDDDTDEELYIDAFAAEDQEVQQSTLKNNYLI